MQIKVIVVFVTPVILPNEYHGIFEKHGNHNNYDNQENKGIQKKHRKNQ